MKFLGVIESGANDFNGEGDFNRCVGASCVRGVEAMGGLTCLA